MFKLSKHLYLFEKDGSFALWNALNSHKLYGDKKLKDVFCDLKKNEGIVGVEELQKYPPFIVSEFFRLGFLYDSSHNENSIFYDLIKESEKIEIKNLVLLIAKSCNFNCSYCQIEKNIQDKRETNMSKEIAEKAIDLFKKHCKEASQKTITITGGEPLLNPDVLKFIVKKLNKEIKNKRIVLFTNGSLITKELIDLFKENDVLVLLSLDGPKEMHDIARKDKGGQGTFSTVINAYQQLKENHVKVGVSAVGGKHNIENLSVLIDFFLDLDPSSIGLNFSHHLLEEENPMEISISEFGKKLVEFYKVMREKNIFVENISRIIRSFSSHQPRLHECQAEGTGFTVDARGKIGPCKSLLVSDIYSLELDEVKEITTTKLFLDWNKRTPLRIPECQHCPSVMLCGGGCAYDSYIVNDGKFKQVDKRVCDYQNYVLEFLIWDLFDKIKTKVGKNSVYSPSKAEQLFAFNHYYEVDNALQRSVGHEN